jgi:cephalosporin hydroxylase
MTFDDEVRARIAAAASDPAFRQASHDWMRISMESRYSYNFAWLSRPIIQYPQDIVAMQELIWAVRPDLIIETGIAHGGSLVLSASMLALLDYCDAAQAGTTLDPRRSRRKVLGVDIDIRAHNRAAIEAHPMAHHIQMVQGSSIDEAIVAQVRAVAREHQRVLVCLDSNHTHAHVLAELELYAPLTSVGSYCCVFDTVVEDMPPGTFPDRPWDKGNSPKTAVREYLAGLEREPRQGADGSPLAFEVDHVVEDKLLITVAPHGYLKRVAR